MKSLINLTSALVLTLTGVAHAANHSQQHTIKLTNEHQSSLYANAVTAAARDASYNYDAQQIVIKFYNNQSVTYIVYNNNAPSDAIDVGCTDERGYDCCFNNCDKN